MGDFGLVFDWIHKKGHLFYTPLFYLVCDHDVSLVKITIFYQKWLFSVISSKLQAMSRKTPKQLFFLVKPTRFLLVGQKYILLMINFIPFIFIISKSLLRFWSAWEQIIRIWSGRAGRKYVWRTSSSRTVVGL